MCGNIITYKQYDAVLHIKMTHTFKLKEMTGGGGVGRVPETYFLGLDPGNGMTALVQGSAHYKMGQPLL